MPDFMMIALVLYVPLTLVCGVIFALGCVARHQGAGRVMRLSALIWFVVLGLVFLFVIIGSEVCRGNMLYGYHNCTVLPANIANLSLPLVVLGVVGGGAYGVILLVVSSVLEWRHRERARDIA